MYIYKLKWTRLQSEIFRLLCIKINGPLNQRGVARILNVSPTAVAKSIKLLEKENIVNVVKSKTMNLTNIELNRDNKRIIKLKQIENLKMIYDSNLLEILTEKFPGSTIILFGSYSKGEDVLGSDIDIAIVGIKKKDINLTKYDKLFERTIFLHFYPDLKGMNKNLKENILNGIILYGGIEL